MKRCVDRAALTALALIALSLTGTMTQCGMKNLLVEIPDFDVADVRGLDDLQRAEAIISNCAAEEYQDQLFKYFEASKKLGGHHPQNPQMAFEWYRRLKETGTMHGN